MDPFAVKSRLTKPQLREFQNRKLHKFITEQIYPFSRHYQHLFNQNKIDPKKIKTIEDLQRIPFTSKADLIPVGQDSERFRDFILQPDKDKIRRHWPLDRLFKLMASSMVRGPEYAFQKIRQEYKPVFITFTTGTTARPVPFVYSQYDIKNLYTSGARMIDLFCMNEVERSVNMFPYAPHLAFWQVVFGGLAADVLILSTGGGKVMTSEASVGTLLKMKPSMILGVPSYVYHVLRIAKEKGCDLSSVRKVVLGASKVTDSFKLRLMNLLAAMGAHDVAVFGTYGFTEARCAWGECPSPAGVSSGYHLYPDKEIFEIVDPKTGEVRKDGEDGELVYTPIDSRASTVIRYRTGDFVKGGITYEPCPYCHRTVPRISSDIIRISDVQDIQLSKIKGTLVNFNNFTYVLSDLEAVTEWQIEIRKKDNDPFEVDELVIYVCVKNGTNCVQLEEEIRKKISLATEISPNAVVFLPIEEIVKRLELETASKERRIIDSRPKN